VGWLLYSTIATLASKPRLTPNGDVAHYLCVQTSSYFWDCKDAIQEQAGSFDDLIPAKKSSSSGAFDDLIPKTKSQNKAAGIFDDVPLAKKPTFIDPYDSNDAHVEPFGVNDALLNQVWVLDWGKFLSFSLLPILAFWVIPFISIWLIKWIKEGFKKGDKP
jgi:hypothetical protein